MNLHITPEELKERLQDENPPHLLDVREPEEHELVSLPKATLIPLGQVFTRAAEIQAWKDQEIVVYCHHGIRSMHAITQLRALGFNKLQNLTGGIDAWSLTVDQELTRY